MCLLFRRTCDIRPLRCIVGLLTLTTQMHTLPLLPLVRLTGGKRPDADPQTLYTRCRMPLLVRMLILNVKTSNATLLDVAGKHVDLRKRLSRIFLIQWDKITRCNYGMFDNCPMKEKFCIGVSQHKSVCFLCNFFPYNLFFLFRRQSDCSSLLLWTNQSGK